MSGADPSWIGTPLPGNQHIAEQARDLVAAAERVVAKQDALVAALAKHVGKGQDLEKIATASVDHTGRALSLVIDSRAYQTRTQREIEAASAQAFAAAHDDLQAKRATTEKAFRKALELDELPTADEIYERFKREEQEGRRS